MPDIIRIATIVWFLLLGACTTVTDNSSEVTQAFVMIPKDQTAGVSTINSLDGEAVDFVDLLAVPPGVHTLGVACKLDNGVGLSYSLQIDFEPEHYYCIKAVKPGKTCAVGYVKSTDLNAARVACLFMG